MSGHGHVTPNADGSKARCGGPGICAACSRESAALAAAQGRSVRDALAARRLSTGYMLSEAVNDLSWLFEYGAMTGVAEVLRERRKQIEQLGWTPEHDRREHIGGTLLALVREAAVTAFTGVFGGTDGPAECEHHLAKTGALAAAEIDRLATESGPPETVTYRCWTNGSHIHHVHKPGDPCPLGQAGREAGDPS